MFSRRLKTGYFILEGLNSFALVYYLYYLYFLMRESYGFGNQANLGLAALNGGISALAAFFGGKLAQRFGYFVALKSGLLMMIGSLSLGLFVDSAAGQIGVMAGTVMGMCFTWPALEALVSEGEPRAGLQHMVGVYNVIWAATAALANFCGGAMFQHLGKRSLFYIPVAVQVGQFAFLLWLEHQARRNAQTARPAPANRKALLLQTRGALASKVRLMADASPVAEPDELHPHPPNAKTFLRMAWLANPFAYIAINTVVAVVPGVAAHLHLTPTLAGFCCSVWCFARLGAFALLWAWHRWHYRFGWLMVAFLALITGFIVILLAPNVSILVGSQLLFGSATGLIYYSSLFYSMDAGEAKGEHGGMHEAAIGVGNFAGPAVGALALQVAPGYAHSGAVAVSVLLLGGFAALCSIWRLRPG